MNKVLNCPVKFVKSKQGCCVPCSTCLAFSSYLCLFTVVALVCILELRICIFMFDKFDSGVCYVL